MVLIGFIHLYTIKTFTEKIICEYLTIFGANQHYSNLLNKIIVNKLA